MRSDKAVGLRYNEAIRLIDRLDLWDEVIDLVTDDCGIVIRVIH